MDDDDDRKLLITFAVLLLLLLQVLPTCTDSLGLGGDICNITSSCGDIRNISYPFRLNTDPISCGDKQFEITCYNNVPMLIYRKSERYYVRSIDYDRYIVRLSDASLVPLPNNNTFFCNHSHNAGPYTVGRPDSFLSNYSSAHLYFGKSRGGDNPHDYNLVIISCPSPLAIGGESYEWSRYVDGAICSTGHGKSDEYSQSSTTSNYWYATVSHLPIDAADVDDSCRVELMLVTSLAPRKSKGNVAISFHDVLDSWSYGFEVSWFDSFCFLGSHAFPCTEESGTSLATFVFRMLVSAVLQLHTAFFLIGLPLMMILVVYKWRRRHRSFYDNIEDFLDSTYDQLMPIRYSYKDIKKMTNGFRVQLGQGGYGCVYKGKLRSGQHAAVKMLGKADTSGKDFINEVATIGRVHHFNVVRLIGFCSEGSKRALVYPFMVNGSLEKYILRGDTNGMPTISDEKMYEIAIGVARGIEYLHSGCEMQILHFDIKPHNVLLDENFVPKIADFGLAKLYPTNQSIVSITAAKGTIGYMAPEFFYRSVGGISYKADVYSYGRMLMEMAARKRDPGSAAENSSQIFLPSWVHDRFSQGDDVWLGDIIEEEKQMRKKMMMVGLWCVQLYPADRPSMHRVVRMLQGGLDALQLPQKPSFAPPFLPANMEDSSTGITSTGPATSSYYFTCDSADTEDV